jgi:chromosomal replication initiator protein
VARPDLTFERFAPTRGSRPARQLARAMAEETMGAPRLLLVYGPPGVGKTHVLHATVNLGAARRPGPSLFVDARHLVEQWIAALARDPRAPFPLAVEPPALVAIDDLHALAGKPATQREMARALEGLVERGGHVVGALGRSPHELPVFVDRLERIPGVRIVAMPPPAGRDLRNLLGRMARAAQVPLGRRTLAAIADRCQGDVRRAQGELARRRFERSRPFVRSLAAGPGAVIGRRSG